MKNLYYTINSFLIFFQFVFLTSCSDYFSDILPLDKISEAQYWKSSNDALLYVNNFYSKLSLLGGTSETGVPIGDKNDTDNFFSDNYSKLLAGERTLGADGATWSYSNIRSVNYFLQNYNKISDNFDNYKQYVGEAYFFRAYFYYDLLKKFGDVPYVDKVLDMDSEELYFPRRSRQEIADYIVSDLDIAIEYMQSGPIDGGTRINKEIAQLFKSRVCLYEGSWEKYHNNTVFGVDSPKSELYFKLASNSALDVINSRKYSIFENSQPNEDYFNVFNQTDYSNHQEVMLWKKYSGSLGMVHRRQLHLNFEAQGGLTKNAVDDYLCIDGLPIAVSPVYKGDKTISDVLQNRDPRLRQTVWGPDDAQMKFNGETLFTWKKAPIIGGSSTSHNIGGFQVKKGANINGEVFLDFGTFTQSTVGDPVFRFAEVLLNYAEAKAELGEINQRDIDISINVLRDRAGMPRLEIDDIIIDPNWLFPELSALINEIRRERRIELILEDFRWDDLARWRAVEGVVKNKRFLGAPWQPDLYTELTVGKNVNISDDGKYFDPYQISLPTGFQFNADRDYLVPIAIEQLTLNENLAQNPGW